MQTNLKPLTYYFTNLTKCCALALSVFMLATTTYAADCKGQAKDICVKNGSCSWVESYKRKDGRTVNGFCRTKTKGFKAKPAQPKRTNGSTGL